MSEKIAIDESIKVEFIHGKAVDTHQKIVNYLNGHDISKVCYAHKSRVKSEDGLLEKVIRKKKEKEEYCLEDITDVIGVRFVVLYKKDIVTTIRQIIKILKDSGNSKNPFMECDIAEAIYYIGDVSSSNITSDVEECFQNIDINCEIKDIKEGYSSVHIVCHLKAISSKLIPSGLRIPVEIQVRTVFEDAWGEIDHRHRYGLRDINDSTSHPTLSQHLSTLKKFVDACVDYADIIVEESRIELNPKNSAKILDNPKDIVDSSNFFEEDVEIDEVEKYILLTGCREKAILSGKHNELVTCAQSFLDLRKSHMLNKSLETFDNFSFYCCINEALCQLSINKEASLLLARNLYLELHELDKENCLVAMRLGQALGRIGDIEKGIRFLKKSFSLAQNNNSKFPVKKVDIDYVLSKSPKIIGYYIWLKIESLREEVDSDAIVTMYLEAYEYTMKGLEYFDKSSSDFVDYTNNLLFYLTRLYDITRSNKYKELLSKELRALEASFNDLNGADAKTLDTLLRAYIALEDKTNFLSCAQILRGKIRSRDYDFDHETALNIMEIISEFVSLFNEA
ncbi:RelA/SpoT domain-containing protein [Psychrobacter maritimus]|jgi:ppGpp synthetase/RelA/SpoT-type nucleotidyltranferase|uniref:RelA/SpoT domain-containing protein n=1 Tax=Psychrobacter maritimus TaxID=256325 RepID=UPI001917F7B4|nr:RelA/SpoT domain-containing protein [Psychrobacter maritimus]